MEHENMNTPQKPPLQQTAVMWRFIAFKNLNDYNEAKPYFEKAFDNHTELKTFSAKHSSVEKLLHPEYISTYHRL
jgi:hypothetical protein